MPLIDNFISLFNESAPWLLLGLLIAGVIKSFIPNDYLARHLGGKGLKATIKAAFIGAPLPLCSCGVVPAALGIRRSGGSKNATIAFLVATPETGIDSMSITYALMGPFMTIIRPIAAIVSAICAGMLVGKSEENAVDNKPEDEVTGCCSKKKETNCSEPETQEVNKAFNFSHKLKQGIRFAFIDMFNDIAIWLIVGLLFAAIIQTFVPESFLTQWGSSWVAFILMAVIGVPMYICATASTPIAAGLLLSGVSPGAVLVFMLVGPATNIGTLVIIKNELGKRPVIAYLIGIIACSFIFGALTNYLIHTLNIDILPEIHDHAQSGHWFTTVCSAILAALCIIALMKKINNAITRSKA